MLSSNLRKQQKKKKGRAMGCDFIPVVWCFRKDESPRVSIWLDDQGTYQSDGVDLDQQEAALTLWFVVNSGGDVEAALGHAKDVECRKATTALKKVLVAKEKKQPNTIPQDGVWGPAVETVRGAQGELVWIVNSEDGRDD